MPFRRRIGLCAVLLIWSWPLSEAAHAQCRMKGPDLSISGIKLTDAASAVDVVGYVSRLEEEEDDLPRARFVSTHGEQELVLFAPYGADANEYSEAEVRITGADALALKDLPLPTFKTGRGVELGMSVKEIEALFGRCTKSRQRSGDELLIEYEIDKADRDPELKEFGFPLYFAEYQFTRGKLSRFRFGFAYP